MIKNIKNMTNKLSHVLVTNMTYTENHPKFKWRLAWYEAMVFPRILKQTNQNFDIAVKYNPIHDELFKKISDRIITFHEKPIVDERPEYKKWDFFTNYIKWKDIEGLDMYDIQTYLSSDDLVSPEYIQRVKDEVAKNLDTSLHINFQPKLFDLWNLDVKEMRKKYSSGSASGFLSLYQPDKTNYVFIREDDHKRMAKHARKSITIPEGYCWISIHGANDSSTMNI